MPSTPTDEESLLSGDAPQSPKSSGLSSRPTTPSRQMSNPLLRQSSSPRQKSGLKFGSPRKTKDNDLPVLPNPFADMPTSRSVSPESDAHLKPLKMPSRIIAYPRANEPENYGRPQITELRQQYVEAADPFQEKGSYDAEIDDADEQTDDDEEACIMSPHGAEKSIYKQKTLVPKEVKRNRLAFLRPRIRSISGKVYFAVLSVLLFMGLIMAAVVLWLSFGVQTPRAHWKGTLTASIGTADRSGLLFTRYVNLGFTSASMVPMALTSLDVSATFNMTTPIGHGNVTELHAFSVPSRNTRNATLPLEMAFRYTTAQDPSGALIKMFYKTCTSTTEVPIELHVEADVRIAGFVHRHVDMGTLAASLPCGSNLASLSGQMLAFEGITDLS